MVRRSGGLRSRDASSGRFVKQSGFGGTQTTSARRSAPGREFMQRAFSSAVPGRISILVHAKRAKTSVETSLDAARTSAYATLFKPSQRADFAATNKKRRREFDLP